MYYCGLCAADGHTLAYIASGTYMYLDAAIYTVHFGEVLLNLLFAAMSHRVKWIMWPL